MSKEKQIEEMTAIIEQANEQAVKNPRQLKILGQDWFGKWYASALYDAGCRMQSEWISVDERLPEDGKNVLCFENGKFYIAFFEKYEEGAWRDWVAYDRDDTWNEVCPSHWMPLPEPPQTEGGAE